MLISVASGKGEEQGRPRYPLIWPIHWEKRANLIDCDVDEPNAHLFLNPVFDHKDKAYTIVPEVDTAPAMYAMPEVHDYLSVQSDHRGWEIPCWCFPKCATVAAAV